MLWTHFGVSGPVALDASRHWLRAQIDGAPCRHHRELPPRRTIRRRRSRLDASGRGTSAGVGADGARHDDAGVRSRGAAPPPRRSTAARRSRIFRATTRRRLSHALVEWPLPVTGSRGYNFAEATAGGVALTEIDPSTMESRIRSGLYLVGEMLDVDGRIGGFNFQWAWSTGYVAGRGDRRRRHLTPSRSQVLRSTFMRRPFPLLGIQVFPADARKHARQRSSARSWPWSGTTTKSASATPARTSGSSVAYTTVMTTMDRLFKKGLLARRKVGPGVSSTSAAATREELDGAVAAELVQSLLQRDGSGPLPILSSLVDAVSDRDRALLDELERLIREKRRQVERQRPR